MLKKSVVTIAIAGAVFLAGYFAAPGICQARRSVAGNSQPMNSQAQLIDAPSFNPNFFVELSKKVIPSVVNLAVTVSPVPRANGQGAEDFRKYFEEFFGHRRPLPQGFGGPTPLSGKRKALGTGVIVKAEDDRAVVLTNHHVVDMASDIEVQLDKGFGVNKIKGKVIGLDKYLDLALVELKLPDEVTLKALPFGDSGALEVGEFVMAVGNPFGQGHSVSHGIISAKERSAPIFGKYLQTDAPINPGNSGGPLVNMKGEIVGINNAILARAQGIGFAIPSNSIKSVMSQLMSDGKVERGYLGIQMGQISPEAAVFAGNQVVVGQPYVAAIEEDSPADKAGLKQNDVILKFNDKPIKDTSDLLLGVSSYPIGRTASMKIIRLGREVDLKIKVGRRPS